MTGPIEHDPDAAEPRPGDAAHRVVCQEVVELLGDYLEGALDDPLRGDVDAHLAACPECRLFLHQLEVSVSLVGGLPPSDDLPPEVRDLLVETFRDVTGRRPH